MDEDDARAVQVVAAVLAVAAISITALVVMRDTTPTQNVLVVVGGAFTLIASLLGVHWGVQRVMNGGGGRSR